MGVRGNEAPAGRAAPRDDGGEVAVLVVTVAHRPGLVSELERAEEDHAPAVLGEDAADRPLRPAELGEDEGAVFAGVDAAADAGIGGVIARGARLGAELDRAAAIVAGRRRR